MNYFLLVLTAPFLFFLPGYWITKTFFSCYDRIERCILSVFLSLALLYGGIFGVEKIADKITMWEVFGVIIGINLFCLALTFFRRH